MSKKVECPVSVRIKAIVGIIMTAGAVGSFGYGIHVWGFCAGSFIGLAIATFPAIIAALLFNSALNYSEAQEKKPDLIDVERVVEGRRIWKVGGGGSYDWIKVIRPACATGNTVIHYKVTGSVVHLLALNHVDAQWSDDEVREAAAIPLKVSRSDMHLIDVFY